MWQARLVVGNRLRTLTRTTGMTGPKGSSHASRMSVVTWSTSSGQIRLPCVETQMSWLGRDSSGGQLDCPAREQHQAHSVLLANIELW